MAVWDGGTSELKHHIRWIRKNCETGRAVMVLDTTGTGSIAPNPLNGVYPPQEFYGVIFKFAHDLMWLGDSLAALRTYDVTRAVDAVMNFPGLKKDELELYAYGYHGLYAQLAAFVDERIKGLEVQEGMGSFKSWVGARHYNHLDIMSVNLPGVLEHFDLPELKKWILERGIAK